MIKIAIDGPSGSGKSTVAKTVSARLRIVYVDTGALYRSIGYYVREKGADPTDADGVAALLPGIKLDIKYENGSQFVYLNGENLGDRIREPEISMYASAVSAIGAVRDFLLETQRDIARKNSVIMDGRDIGTVILPDADVKIFMTASPEARAKRRFDELVSKGIDVSYEEVIRDMTERDANDAGRDIAPCVPAEDAVMLDNSNCDREQCAEKVIEIIKSRVGDKI